MKTMMMMMLSMVVMMLTMTVTNSVLETSITVHDMSGAYYG